MSEKRTKLICFLVNEREKAKIKENATRVGLKVAPYVRSHVIEPEVTSSQILKLLSEKILDIMKTTPIPYERLRPPPAKGYGEVGEAIERKKVPTPKLTILDAFISKEKAKELAETQKKVVEEMDAQLKKRRLHVEGIEIAEEEEEKEKK